MQGALLYDGEKMRGFMQMGKRDLLESIKEEAVNTAVEGIIPELVKEMVHGTVLEAMGGALSIAVPRLGGIMLTYQQKRFSHNMEKFIREVARQQDEINKRLDSMEEELRRKIIDEYTSLITDYVIKAKQDEKIKYIVNGYRNLPSQGEFSEDFLLLYYDVLDELNILDLRVLRICVPGGIQEDNYMRILKDYHIDMGQLKHIVDKLYRNGLLKKKSEDNTNENFRRIVSYIQNPEGKLELIDVGEIGLHEQSEFGKNFIKFFEI